MQKFVSKGEDSESSLKLWHFFFWIALDGDEIEKRFIFKSEAQLRGQSWELKCSKLLGVAV